MLKTKLNNMFKQSVLLFLLAIAFYKSNAQQPTLVKNVNLINTATGTIEKNAMVIIDKAGNLKNVAKTKGLALKTYKIIDAKGQYLMEALNDMHIHWPDTLANNYFNLVNQAGIGHVRVMKSTTDAINFAAKTQNLTLDNCYPVYKNTYMPNVEAFVDSIKNAHYNFIKTFSIKDEATFLQLATAAKNKQLAICGHALDNVSPKVAFENGYRSVEHVGYLDNLKRESAIDSTIELFKQYKVSICPTLDWMLMAYHALNKDSFKYRAGYNQALPLYKTYWDTLYNQAKVSFGADEPQYAKFAKNSIAKKLSILKKCHKAGVNIILGSDAEEPYQVPGFSLIEEMKIMASAGFSNAEVLKMVTVNCKLYYAQINEHKDVPINTNTYNYILLKQNPLDNLDNLTSITKILKLQY